MAARTALVLALPLFVLVLTGATAGAAVLAQPDVSASAFGGPGNAIYPVAIDPNVVQRSILIGLVTLLLVSLVLGLVTVAHAMREARAARR